jgi:predicted nucleotidyltransferase
MSQQELLKRVVEALDRAGIDYMITGSVASSLQGEPRSTHDLDVVVEIGQEDVPALRSAFPRPRFYLEEEAAREAIRTGGMFNVIEAAEGDKIDFWLLTDQPFDRSRFGRKVEEDVFGINLKVSRPEDTILAKLRWASMMGGSEKAYMDALRVFEVQAAGLDRSYLDAWVARLGLQDLWRRLRAEAEEL